MLTAGRETALLRFSLGEVCLRDGEPVAAAAHLERAVALDPDYSAAWKVYGRALTAAGRDDDAAAVLERGIDVAEARGDKQAAKEMRVFAKRLRKKQKD